jgi:hypothetical protein
VPPCFDVDLAGAVAAASAAAAAPLLPSECIARAVAELTALEPELPDPPPEDPPPEPLPALDEPPPEPPWPPFGGATRTVFEGRPPLAVGTCSTY